MKRRRLAMIVGAAALLGSGALYGVGRWRRGPDTVLPAFVEPGPGPRAPAARAFGFELGSATLGEVRAGLVQRGFDCPDTSARALMKRMREDKLRELEEARKRGAGPDAVTGASMLKRPSEREKNPQVRLSCEAVAASKLGDRARPESSGRWLLVFDSPDHPLRHVSYTRSFPSTRDELALADLRDSVAALTQVFGPATTAPSKTAAPPDLTLPIVWEWRFSDVAVKLRAMSFAGRGISIDEAIEVPWPVRASAAARPAQQRGPG